MILNTKVMWSLKGKSMKYIWLFLLLLSSTVLSAQHQPLLSQYMLNGLPLNPGFTGSREALSVAATYRNQWSGFDGAPTTSYLAIHSPLKKEALALGLVVSRDEFGVSKTTGFRLNAAYRTEFYNGKLSFGLSGGMKQVNNAWDELITQDAGDLAFQAGEVSNWLPDFGAGVYFSNKKWYASLSLPTMTAVRYTGGNGYDTQLVAGVSHLYFNSGIKLPINADWEIQPSMMMRYLSGSSNQLDLNALMNWKDTFEFGFSYRSSRQVVGIVRYYLNPQTSIAYGYDQNFGSLSRYASGSHEITLRYDFIFRTNASSPKFF